MKIMKQDCKMSVVEYNTYTIIRFYTCRYEDNETDCKMSVVEYNTYTIIRFKYMHKVINDLIYIL